MDRPEYIRAPLALVTVRDDAQRPGGVAARFTGMRPRLETKKQNEKGVESGYKSGMQKGVEVAATTFVCIARQLL